MLPIIYQLIIYELCGRNKRPKLKSLAKHLQESKLILSPCLFLTNINPHTFPNNPHPPCSIHHASYSNRQSCITLGHGGMHIHMPSDQDI